jgi:hypothetical protein
MFAKTELWIVHPGGAVRDDLFDSTVVEAVHPLFK